MSSPSVLIQLNDCEYKYLNKNTLCARRPYTLPMKRDCAHCRLGYTVCPSPPHTAFHHWQTLADNFSYSIGIGACVCVCVRVCIRFLPYGNLLSWLLNVIVEFSAWPRLLIPSLVQLASDRKTINREALRCVTDTTIPFSFSVSIVGLTSTEKHRSESVERTLIQSVLQANVQRNH